MTAEDHVLFLAKFSDCVIADYEGVSYLKEKGKDLIVVRRDTAPQHELDR